MRRLNGVDAWIVVAGIALVALVGGLGVVVGVRLGRRGTRAAGPHPLQSGARAAAAQGAPPGPATSAATSSTVIGVLPDDVGVVDVFDVLRSGAVVLDESDAAVACNQAAQALGLVRDGNLVHPELRQIAREVRRSGRPREAELDLARGPIGEGMVAVTARVTRFGARHMLLLVEDHTQARRVEAVRRDFVANVSHELKTPVGGIALLAEAVLDANDDPDAVARFARRIKVESDRLTRLVQEIVDLSRLQASESVDSPDVVDAGDVVVESLELMSTLAESHQTFFAVSVGDDVTVLGDHTMLRTAVANLLTNAINYSPEGTRVAVSVRRVADLVEIAVADQGSGIPAGDIDRIFERFYRVDAARSRATGGTGLGLAIVKHICSNHGGDITVWSSEGNGSTFTIRLPAWSPGLIRTEPVGQAGADAVADPRAAPADPSATPPDQQSAPTREARP